jgi:hypothetical protein
MADWYKASLTWKQAIPSAAELAALDEALKKRDYDAAIARWWAKRSG